MRIDHTERRASAPRLVGASAVILGALVVMLIAYSGGASAAPGPTDLSITKTDSPDPVVTDNLPASKDVDFVSATSTAGTCKRTGDTVTCELGTVTAGSNQTVTIVV